MNRLLALLFLLLPSTLGAQTSLLREDIARIIMPKRAVTGIAILGPDGNEIIALNDHHRYPMQSVFKFHLALAVLDQADRGKLQLDQIVHITSDELMAKTWSPMRDDHPEGAFDITIADLLHYTVAKSDNIGCDVLFRLVGGTAEVDSFIRTTGVTDVAIAATEEEMHRDWDVQYTNWTTPSSAVHLMQKFFRREILSETGSAFLWKTMVKTSTGPKRIRGLLPSGTLVANKTGTSGPNEHGMSAATNDIGIVQLPDGRHFMIAVFVTDSYETHETNERVIAEVTQAAWKHFSGQRGSEGMK